MKQILVPTRTQIKLLSQEELEKLTQKSRSLTKEILSNVAVLLITMQDMSCSGDIDSETRFLVDKMTLTLPELSAMANETIGMLLSDATGGSDLTDIVPDRSQQHKYESILRGNIIWTR